jgi:hypothetical protein
MMRRRILVGPVVVFALTACGARSSLDLPGGDDSPCNVCPPALGLCVAPLAPVASLPAGICEGTLPPCNHRDLTCGPSGVFTVGGYPDALAFDGTNMWVANGYSDNITKLSPSGVGERADPRFSERADRQAWPSDRRGSRSATSWPWAWEACPFPPRRSRPRGAYSSCPRC